jgi:hypothetical protein
MSNRLDAVRETGGTEETPAWIDDTRHAAREEHFEKITDDQYSDREDRVDDPARAVYQLVDVPHRSGWFQFLADRVGLTYHGVVPKEHGGEHWWTRPDGLYVYADCDTEVVETDGPLGIDTRLTGDGYDAEPSISYVTITGPADAVASTATDLLALASNVKRELRPPSRLADTDDDGTVPEEARLVPRDVSATVVSRLRSELPDTTDTADTGLGETALRQRLKRYLSREASSLSEVDPAAATDAVDAERARVESVLSDLADERQGARDPTATATSDGGDSDDGGDGVDDDHLGDQALRQRLKRYLSREAPSLSEVDPAAAADAVGADRARVESELSDLANERQGARDPTARST